MIADRTWLAAPSPDRNSGRPATLDRLVLAQAERTPGAEALLVGESAYSYGWLAERSAELAAGLAARGVTAGSVVGIALERDEQLPAALLAVLRTGAAYLPLDPKYPAERLRFMIADAGVAAIVSQRRVAAELPVVGELPVLLVDEPDQPDERADRPPGQAGAGGSLPERLAYLIYTSGSTGRPKGVAIEHRAAVALLEWARRRFPPELLSGLLAATSINFDLSVFELFLPLATGGRVILASDLLALPELPRRHQVRLVNTVPSVMRELLRIGGLPPSVKAVNLAGEPLPRELAQALYEKGVERVFNLYGPSEDTTYSTCYAVPPPAGEQGIERQPAIGRPIAGTRAYVLDGQAGPVTGGDIGHLHLAGRGLARGYAGRPALTAAAFVPDPFSDEPGERMYRTGDLARWNGDDELEFFGRIDQQIKLRGFRIELGEIESLLRGEREVADAAVTVRTDAAGEKELVAYVVAAPASGPPPPPEGLWERLRAMLARSLPPYMVPAAGELVERLPQTASGKIDRRALAELAQADPGPSAPAAIPRPATGRPPRGEAEEGVAALVAELLGLPAGGVAADDDLFALGAHSLHMTRLAARIAERFGERPPLALLFSRPTVAALAAALAEVGAGSALAALPPPEARGDRGPAPLSITQEGLALGTAYDLVTPLFNVPLAVTLEGPLDPERLGGALQRLVARHGALRTVIESTAEGELVQRALPRLPGPLLEVIDLEAHGPSAEHEAQRLADRRARRPFALDGTPLLRCTLLRLDRERHLLLLTMHHLITDGWSEGLLLSDLARLYGEEAEPEAPIEDAGGEPERLTHIDFARWERRHVTEELLAGVLQRSRERVGDDPGSFSLPPDRPRPAVVELAGEVVRSRLPAELSDRLDRRARQLGATRFTLLLAAFELLLARSTGESRVLVGVPVSGRLAPGLEEVVGAFVNSVLIRTELTSRLTASEAMERVAAATAVALADQELPFLWLARAFALQPGEEAFRVMFNLQDAFGLHGSLAGGAVRYRGRELPTGTAKVDLSLIVDAGSDGGGLDLVFEYRANLYDRTTIERLAERYRLLAAALAEVLAEPGAAALRVGELPLLSPAERRQLGEWNDTAAPSAPDDEERVDLQIWRAAARTPERIAVAMGERWLSYGELVRRAGALAGRLAAAGIGPGQRVAVCLPRGPAQLIALLAVMRRGAAYVPLDPGHPQQRQRLVLADAAVAALVGDVASLAPFSDLPPDAPRRIVIDGGGRAVDPAGDDAAGDAGGDRVVSQPAAPLPAGGVAYVLFTSGSTGRPKGVAVPHRALANLFADFRHRLGIDAAAVVAGLATFTFDISVVELLLPLTVGARIELVPEETAQDGQELGELVLRRGVTVLQATPVSWRLLAESAWPGDRGLLAITGGEALEEDLRRRLVPRVGRLWNIYGPTEATVYCVGGPVDAEGSITIGHALRRAGAYIVDRWGYRAPPGAPGELWIGGSGLAHGYLGRPALTAAAFVPDPFGGAGAAGGRPGGDRLYRTGDLARRLPDGRVAYLGRIDQQLKVRGFRIEPGEIETALLAHPAVQRAVVVALQRGPGDLRLAAYLVGDLTPERADGELRTALAERLPSYMVPAYLVPLPELPVTPSGKVDRKALPAPWELDSAGRAGAAGPGSATPGSTTVPTPPRDPIEEELAAVAADLLGLERVGVEDDFHTLGADSLTLNRLMLRAQRRFRVTLSLRELFRAGLTVAGLATVVRQASDPGGEGGGGSPDVEAEPPLPRDRPLPLSYSQLREWFLVQLEPESSAYNSPLVLELAGGLQTAALGAALARLTVRHEVLRTSFLVEHGEPRQVVAPPSSVPAHATPPLVDLGRLAGESQLAEARRLLHRVSWRPFDLGRGWLLRTLLLRLSLERHLLALVQHHIITDGWSFRVLVRDLVELYGAAHRGAPAALPELPLQYADFAHRQRRQLDGEGSGELVSYWRRTLDGAPRLTELPLDRPWGERGTRRGAMIPLSLPAAPAQRLARGSSSSLFTVLLAAYSALLARHAGQGEINVGTFSASRHHPGLEDLLGYFLNTLVLRCDLTGDPSFERLVERCRDVTAGAFQHQDLPFERLLAGLDLERDQLHPPLIQCMLLLQEPPADQLEKAGLDWRMSGLIEVERALFALTLWIVPVGDDRLEGALQIDRDLFDLTTGQRLARRFELLAGAALADPGRSLMELPLLSAAERHQLMVEWRTAPSRPRPLDPARRPWGRIGEALARQAAERPAAVALVAGEEHLTYAGLLLRVRRLAGRLRRLGVGAEARVALALPRGPRQIVSLLAVLEAGGCYLPLALGDPPARLRRVVSDAGAVAILADGEGEQLFADGGAPAPLLRPTLEGGLEAVGGGAAETAAAWASDLTGDLSGDLADPVRAGELAAAYAIYTSGSTGRPKGVVIGHRSLSEFAWSSAISFGLEPGERLLQFAVLSFDTSVEEIFSTLTSGATLVLREERMIDSPAFFFAELERLAITVLDLPTAYWHELARHLAESAAAVTGAGAPATPADLPPAVRLVIIAGEQALAERLAGWREAALGYPVLLNSYGPAEATVVGAEIDLADPYLTPGSTVPIGRPLPGCSVAVLDRLGRPLPIGVAGELCLGGSLARGYIGQPGLTADRFRPDALAALAPERGPGEGSGRRLYRTGDRGRWLASGILEMLGRLDEQIKVRGFRVELGEIEQVLVQHPAVAEAAAVAVAVAPGDLRLVVHLGGSSQPTGGALDEEQVRRYLQGLLPPYMMPAAIVLHDRLPHSTAGKIDRRALLALGVPAAAGGAALREPEGITEEVLLEIWQALLGRSRVGTDQSFFDLGGHSLLVPQLVARVEEAFQVALPVRKLFSATRIVDQAVLVEEELLAQIEALSDEELGALEDLDDAPR